MADIGPDGIGPVGVAPVGIGPDWRVPANPEFAGVVAVRVEPERVGPVRAVLRLEPVRMEPGGTAAELVERSGPVSRGSDSRFSDRSGPVWRAPVWRAPDSKDPVEIAPVEWAPVEIAPVEWAPVEIAPVEWAPVDGRACRGARVLLDGVAPADERVLLDGVAAGEEGEKEGAASRPPNGTGAEDGPGVRRDDTPSPRCFPGSAT